MRISLSILYFLQFAVWGCYLTSLGQYLGAAGLGSEIAWFYAAIGIVSLVTPALMGHVSDKYISPSRTLSLCHIIAGLIMFVSWIYGYNNQELDFGVMYPLYLFFLAFYLPTMALANTTSFGIIKSVGKLPVDIFPSVRIWGTVGFICAMWMVNSTYWHDGQLGMTLSDSHPYASDRFQYNSMQLLCAACMGLITGLYSLSLPSIRNPYERNKEKPSVLKIVNLTTLKEFFCKKTGYNHFYHALSPIGLFLVFIALIGVCMQISNGYVTPFISHYLGMPEFADSFVAGNATMLFSLSQISEAILILVVGKSLKKWGIGIVLAIGILAWSLRFFFLGIGNPDSGLIFLLISMIVYGVAFNFITIAGHLHIESVSSANNKGLGQGLMMLMSNGIGATTGIIAAGAIINHWCNWEIVQSNNGVPMRLFMGEWTVPWLIFAGYAFILFCLWIFLQRAEQQKQLVKSKIDD
ncbi:MAG: MFS transporter [Muribaculaceae bacterium]|nr:MFS transporter [Muribaculaceae bacterium]